MPPSHELDPRIKAAIARVTGKRARVVIDHILQHGSISTDDLINYGYTHPPRAARDVREKGVPLKTHRVTTPDGRSIAVYEFGDPNEIEHHKLQGRSTLSKDLRDVLYELGGGRCAICGYRYEARYFQVDHRVPYEIVGDVADEADYAAFMLLCGTCQRRKSWSCEHCPNWTSRAPDRCRGCYWVSPESSYTHVAQEEIRRVVLVLGNEDVANYDRWRAATGGTPELAADLFKKALVRWLATKGS